VVVARPGSRGCFLKVMTVTRGTDLPTAYLRDETGELVFPAGLGYRGVGAAILVAMDARRHSRRHRAQVACRRTEHDNRGSPPSGKGALRAHFFFILLKEAYRGRTLSEPSPAPGANGTTCSWLYCVFAEMMGLPRIRRPITLSSSSRCCWSAFINGTCAWVWKRSPLDLAAAC